jgi:hypothetical protein
MLCCSVHSERIKSRRGSLNVPGLTDSFLFEPTDCVQRCQAVNVIAQWTLQENNTLTDLLVPTLFCSAYFPRMFSFSLRIIHLSFSNIHTLIILHLHYYNHLLIFSSVTYLSPHFYNDASLFFVTLL